MRFKTSQVGDSLTINEDIETPDLRTVGRVAVTQTVTEIVRSSDGTQYGVRTQVTHIGDPEWFTGPNGASENNRKAWSIRAAKRLGYRHFHGWFKA